MTISVVIPVFNEEGMIGPCLEHLAAQTLLPNEIIVVDNNCVDATISIASAYPNVRIVTEKQQGIIFARDAGFNAAKGDVILRIDADTRATKNWVKEMHELALHSSADAFTGPCFFYDTQFGKILGLAHRPLYFGISYFYQSHHTLFGSNMAIRKSMWEKMRTEVCTHGDHVIHEDVDLALHIAQAGGKIAYSPKLLVGISGRRMSRSLGDLYPYVTRWLINMKNHVSR
ncbi:MAG: glycosyltransferase [Patescibacteria group bacterium]